MLIIIVSLHSIYHNEKYADDIKIRLKDEITGSTSRERILIS